MNQTNRNCYLCNGKLTGEKINVSTSVTPTSRTGIPEKISHLIGEEFVVVVNDTDLICKRCYNLLGTVDRLESELLTARKTLYACLKGKYKDLAYEEMPDPQPTLTEQFGPEGDALDESVDAALTNGDADASPSASQSAMSVESRRRTEGETNANIASVSTSVENRRRPVADSNSAPIPAKKPTPGLQNGSRNIKTTPRPAGTQINRVKVYKCGFCIFQSKDLAEVRMHMKEHLKQSGTTEADAPQSTTARTASAALTSMQTSSTTSNLNSFSGAELGVSDASISLPSITLPASDSSSLSTPTTAALAPTETTLSATMPTDTPHSATRTPMLKRKVFRCQVCSIAFENRTKCLEHISKDHAPGTRRILNQPKDGEHTVVANGGIPLISDVVGNIVGSSDGNASVAASVADVMAGMMGSADGNVNTSVADIMRNIAGSAQTVANVSISATDIIGSMMGSTDGNASIATSAADIMSSLLGPPDTNTSVSMTAADIFENLLGPPSGNTSVSSSEADILGSFMGSTDANTGIFTSSAADLMGSFLGSTVTNANIPAFTVGAESGENSSQNASGSQNKDTTFTALYSCDSCSAAFDNDIDFAKHLNEHVNAEQMCSIDREMASGGHEMNASDAQKDGSMDMDIEAMLAALNSEGSEGSMPSL